MISISDIYNVNTAVDINLLCVAINFLLSLDVGCMQVSHPLQVITISQLRNRLAYMGGQQESTLVLLPNPKTPNLKHIQ